MLVDVVGVEQRRRLEGGEQVLGDRLDQRLGMAVLVEGREPRCAALRHFVEQLRRRLLKGGELGVAEDGGLHFGDRQLQAGVAGAAG